MPADLARLPLTAIEERRCAYLFFFTETECLIFEHVAGPPRFCCGFPRKPDREDGEFGREALRSTKRRAEERVLNDRTQRIGSRREWMAVAEYHTEC